MTITMKDIAEIVGVSESTVSRAINNKAGVGEKTREEILKVAKKRNFQPNRLAQNLAKQETNVIGLLLPDISSLFYSDVARGVQDYATSRGYQVIVCNTDDNKEHEINYINWLKSNKVAGMIFLGGGLVNNEIVKLGLTDYPIVLANRLVEQVTLPSVLIDDTSGAFKATEHLLDKEYERIGLVLGPANSWQSQNRLQGYKQALRQRGIDYDSDLVLNKSWTRKSGYQGFLELMDLEKPPRAIFAANDLIAAGVVEAIKLGGYFIPQDIAVVGFDDTVVTSVIDPPLTAIARPMHQLGVKSANKLLSLIKEENFSQEIEILESELMIREST
ncbi:MAG: LacI family DNA-binding transcriptional regulator [Bacillota bacterium]